MKVFGFEIINVKSRIKHTYLKDGREAAYAMYRAITGASVQESWQIVKPWIKEWEGKVNGK